MATKIKCPSCNGVGNKRERAKDPTNKGRDQERLRKCPKCNGTGFIKKKDRWDPR